MYLKMGTSGVVVASTPSAARAFLKTLDAQFAHRPNVVSATDITYNYQNMVFSNYGNKWKLMRKLASLHLLGAKAVAGWAPVRRDEMGRILKEMCDAAANKNPVVVPELLVCCLANVVGQITLSKRIFDSQVRQILHMHPYNKTITSQCLLSINHAYYGTGNVFLMHLTGKSN
jgi:flavonoid 3',5'-hydroxylase